MCCVLCFQRFHHLRTNHFWEPQARPPHRQNGNENCSQRGAIKFCPLPKNLLLLPKMRLCSSMLRCASNAQWIRAGLLYLRYRVRVPPEMDLQRSIAHSLSLSPDITGRVDRKTLRNRLNSVPDLVQNISWGKQHKKTRSKTSPATAR